MSLDVYLHAAMSSPSERGSGIFVREDGATRELSRAEWGERFPGLEPVVATVDDDGGIPIVYQANITHNLNRMAEAAGIYDPLWRPDEIGITRACDLIEPLAAGLERLKADPAKFRAYDSPNGWGLYEHFVPFVSDYLDACRANPTATVSTWR